jgi:N-acetylglucosaminyldiphosphoundecaprenol N-acetyl-beta-D-mannosaminyltransferase
MTDTTQDEAMDLLGIPVGIGITADSFCEMLGTSCFVSFVNPSAWALAKRRPEYVEYLRAMTHVLPDGQGVVVAAKILATKDLQRLSFDMSSLAPPFFLRVVEKQASIFLIGGKPGVDEEVGAKLQNNFQGLKIVGSEHGFGEFESKINAVLAAVPDVVIVAMGAPRQEGFLVALRDAGFKGMAVTCGGFFDQYLQADVYYPVWINRWHLRWAYRLYREPKRLWRRYLLDYPYFVFLVLQGVYNSRTKVRPVT